MATTELVKINCPRCGRFLKGWTNNPSIPVQKVDCENCNSTFVIRPLLGSPILVPAWMFEDEE